MENPRLAFLLAAILLTVQVQAHTQSCCSSDEKKSRTQEHAPHEIQLGSKFAETLLIHKEAPPCNKGPDGLRITGTVVIAVTIDKNGKVNHTHTISGPKMLRAMASTTVRKYRYKPYLVNKTPIEFETVVYLPMDCFFHTGQA